MLRYPYFRRTYKECLSCWLEAGIFNLGVKRIHATSERYDEYESQEQTDQAGAREFHRSQDRDSEALSKLHIPVMVDEVVHCLAPQKGQVFSGGNDEPETVPTCAEILPHYVVGIDLSTICKPMPESSYHLKFLPSRIKRKNSPSVHTKEQRSKIDFLDMTFGSGGHTRAILQKEPDITLYALDRDPTAYAIAEQLSELYPKQIRAMLGQFSQAEGLLMKAGVQPGTLDGVLFDLGCSSMQFDAPERGFSLRNDGPLDMRMDGGRYPDMPTAADVVNALDQQALASILRTYGRRGMPRKSLQQSFRHAASTPSPEPSSLPASSRVPSLILNSV